eukprot:2406377-Rhodomonas_salina.1
MLTNHEAAKLHHLTYLAEIKSLQAMISEKNPYKALLDLAYNSEQLSKLALPADIAAVKEINKRIMQLLHYLWGHPSNSKMVMIFKYYKGCGLLKGRLPVQTLKAGAEEDRDKQEQEKESYLQDWQKEFRQDCSGDGGL